MKQDAKHLARLMLSIAGISIAAVLVVMKFSAAELAVGRSNQNANASGAYYWIIPAVEEQRLREALLLLKPGAGLDEILQKCGTPTYDQPLVTKEGQFRVRVLKYYFKVWEKDLVNELHDKVVSLELNEKNLLIRRTSNVDGIPNQ